MPVDWSRYPPDWKAISKRIREERAGNRCEWCGAENGKPHPLTGSKVILTVAHIDAVLPDGRFVSRHNKAHRHEEALVALCQACHLRYDRQDHIRNAAETRRRRRLAAGQLELVTELEAMT